MKRYFYLSFMSLNDALAVVGARVTGAGPIVLAVRGSVGQSVAGGVLPNKNPIILLLVTRAANRGPRSLSNRRQGLYLGLLLVESRYYCFHI